MFHFTLIGMMLFAAYIIMNRNVSDEDEIVVTEQDIDNLVYTWMKKWNRSPNQEELNDLIKGFIEEEILCREAVALGLDEGDNIVRRRLAQKMQFIMDEGSIRIPSESELLKYFEENKERYKSSPSCSFCQITIADNSGNGMKRALKLKEAIKNKQDTTGVLHLGDLTMIPFDVAGCDMEQADSIFGMGFSEEIMNAEMNRWEGPLASGVGIHFIYVYKKQDARDPDFNSVKQRVEQDWKEQQQKIMKTKKLEDLAMKYKVRTELEQWLNATTSLK